MTEELFVKIVLAIITIIGGLVSAYVIPYLKAKFSAEQLDTLAYYITIAVRCAEQIYTPEQWEEKKKYVTNYAKGVINNLVKINLTDEQLDTIIEGIVNEVKKSV